MEEMMQVPAEIVKVLEQKVETKLAADLSAKGREQVKAKNFALPGGRYPIHDKAHARNALARVSQFGAPAERKAVRGKVYARYPELKAEFEERHGVSPTSKGVIGMRTTGDIKKYAQMVDLSGEQRTSASPDASQRTDIPPPAGQQTRVPGQPQLPKPPKVLGMQGGMKTSLGSDLRAEIALGLKTAQERRDPLAQLDEVRRRQIHWVPGLGGVLGGYWAGQRGAEALKERAQAMTEEMRAREQPRIGKYTTTAAPSRRTRIREFKTPFWATKTRGEIGRHIGRKAIVPRASARWGLRLGGPIAGLWGAKALLGKRRNPSYQELMEAGYGKAASALSAVLEKKGQSFFAEHPGMTAAGAGLLGAAAPWIARGIAGQAGYEFDPSALSLGGAALGAGAGLLASRSARKREYKKMMEKARRDAEMQRQQEMALMAMYGGGQGQGQMAPFGGQ